MKTAEKRLYEAMFLVDSAQAASDWDGVNKTIKTILKKAKAEIISIKKWDERRLAYEIGHKSRGTYILCYFRAEGSKISVIERDVQLNEQIMRVLILNAEELAKEDIEKETPAMLSGKQPEESLEEAKETEKKGLDEKDITDILEEEESGQLEEFESFPIKED